MFCPTALSIASYAYWLMPFTEKNLCMCCWLVFIWTISGPFIEDLVLRNRRVVFVIKKGAVNGPGARLGFPMSLGTYQVYTVVSCIYNTFRGNSATAGNCCWHLVRVIVT
jgi:hypothetical protein